MMMQEWFSEGFPVQVPAGTSILDAEMQVPPGANGLIVLAHAGFRPRYSQRVQNVAEYFAKDGFGILVMDLLTEEESEIAKQAEEFSSPDDDETCFDSEMLTERLDDSLQWVRDLPEAAGLPLGLFGVGPGAWAAFTVAAARPGEVSAIVATGLPMPGEHHVLRSVRAPTLLIAGCESDSESAFARECINAVPVNKRLEFVPDAARGREDSPRATEKVSRLACQWFEQHLL